MRERGFNQAELLARQLGYYRGLPVMTNIVKRQKFTRPQVGLNAQQRRNNVAGAFSADPQLIQSGNFILIDDVCTTGATLGACAEALLQSGAHQVWAYTLARAPFAEADHPN
jgi:ComF family protein